jgi:hypothetical protein
MQPCHGLSLHCLPGAGIPPWPPSHRPAHAASPTRLPPPTRPTSSRAKSPERMLHWPIKRPAVAGGGPAAAPAVEGGHSRGHIPDLRGTSLPTNLGPPACVPLPACPFTGSTSCVDLIEEIPPWGTTSAGVRRRKKYKLI